MRPSLLSILAFVLLIGIREAAADCVTGDQFACLSSFGYIKALTAFRETDAAAFFSLDCDFTEPGHPAKVMSDYNFDGVNGKKVTVQYDRRGKPDLFRRNMSPTGRVVAFTIEQNVICK